jgi:hypothetical protein
MREPLEKMRTLTNISNCETRDSSNSKGLLENENSQL